MVHGARLWVRLGYAYIGTKVTSSIFFSYFIIQNRKKHKNGQDCVYLTLKSCLKPRLETPCTRGLTTSAAYNIWRSRVLTVIEVSGVTREDTVVLGHNLSKPLSHLGSAGFSYAPDLQVFVQRIVRLPGTLCSQQQHSPRADPASSRASD